MGGFIQQHLGWVVLAGIALLITLLLTLRTLSRKENVDRGMEKGQAANPERVRRQNPPNHA